MGLSAQGSPAPTGGGTPTGGISASVPPSQGFDPNNLGFGQTPTNPMSTEADIRDPNQNEKNAFLPAQFAAPYYNAAATAGNLGTMQTAGVAPAAAQFMQSQFNPHLNDMEQSFLGAGLSNASRALEQGMVRQEAQFENTPYHSGLARAQGDVMNQVTDSLIGQGAQLGLRREQMANQSAQFPFQYGLEAAQVGPNMSERYASMLNNTYQQPTSLPMGVYTQIPVAAPVVSMGNSGSGGKLG